MKAVTHHASSALGVSHLRKRLLELIRYMSYGNLVVRSRSTISVSANYKEINKLGIMLQLLFSQALKAQEPGFHLLCDLLFGFMCA